MTCPQCADTDGSSFMPSYGPAPHTCFWQIPGATLGESVPLPQEDWPPGFDPDPECPGLGTYWCVHCGEGRPA